MVNEKWRELKMKNIAQNSERDYRILTWILRDYQIRTTVMKELISKMKEGTNKMHLLSSIRDMTTCE